MNDKILCEFKLNFKNLQNSDRKRLLLKKNDSILDYHKVDAHHIVILLEKSILLIDDRFLGNIRGRTLPMQ